MAINQARTAVIHSPLVAALPKANTKLRRGVLTTTSVGREIEYVHLPQFNDLLDVDCGEEGGEVNSVDCVTGSGAEGDDDGNDDEAAEAASILFVYSLAKTTSVSFPFLVIEPTRDAPDQWYAVGLEHNSGRRCLAGW
ncbi:uncharacterized protein ACA1_239280 [Acanthamoeba castellanii str. Neff]|uniref:Uncharacterized protein n=1 Tax=Acanthamoeba castellanii (strain ATCC 30010 / Neff) TaxID=1257118 RepID=L8GJW9_ACACF|nr:uncharacterized protein ACA1_239280 [Acanthamoeba castellanii str. Neff]ELR13332.1 hypothetical protein ACA1_239280 [Acanthamoeba castellanii str. Neff]